jgi:hypothetical protein
MLIADLEEFVADHRAHGPMIGDATELLAIACLALDAVDGFA